MITIGVWEYILYDIVTLLFIAMNYQLLHIFYSFNVFSVK